MLTCFQKYEYISSRFITKSNDVAHVGNATYARVHATTLLFISFT